MDLLKRSKRSFTLTPTGEYFYRKSLVLVADLEAICRETLHIAGHNCELLKIGILKGYSGNEFQNAVAVFSAQFPDVSVEVSHGNHDELYDKLRHDDLDIVLNDQRRAFSDEYHLIRNDSPVIRKYCAFMKLNNPAKHTEQWRDDLQSVRLENASAYRREGRSACDNSHRGAA